MKSSSVKGSCTGLDRLATWDEVRSAMASQGASAVDSISEGWGDVEPDSADSVGVVAERLTWMALLGERLNPKSN